MSFEKPEIAAMPNKEMCSCRDNSYEYVRSRPDGRGVGWMDTGRAVVSALCNTATVIRNGWPPFLSGHQNIWHFFAQISESILLVRNLSFASFVFFLPRQPDSEKNI
ncbi:hypothetical protein CDAR_289971 [Caerostris darwini]|uniref:Uncharacterized protein n=1 Tax=Caerostris darwini TaxID=1538125 RepID=A0AAV4WWU5_9ARAC|nr:hypothetical protein CDAR_289971 [Caerostris darwini]